MTLNTTVSPGSVTVNNSQNDYVISGSGSISGTTTLTKSGSRTLTLGTVNSYTGGTIVSESVPALISSLPGRRQLPTWQPSSSTQPPAT